MQDTPQANRTHIAVFGRTNAGKSTFLNTMIGQDVAMTSPEKGTTTDPVYKAMEIAPLGPCVWIDTAGIDDDTVLGKERVARTRKIMDKTDVAVLVLRGNDLTSETEWLQELSRRKIPTVVVRNVDDEETPADEGQEKDLMRKVSLGFLSEQMEIFSKAPIQVNAKTGKGKEAFFHALEESCRQLEKESSICGELVQAGDSVLLVMPQDIQAPKGRLILPQVQTIRELLDRGCLVQCVQMGNLAEALAQLKRPPRLIITDSQLFAEVAAQKPENSLLTSFSVLFSRSKGDIETFLQGAEVLKKLGADAKILIAEACTHRPLQEDIGRVKLPRLLRKRLGEGIEITVASGMDFPEDATGFDLIIHCGACMFNRRHVMSRVARAKEQGVPITNYGVAIATLTGILDQVVY